MLKFIEVKERLVRIGIIGESRRNMVGFGNLGSREEDIFVSL